jgi:hypothetical protein
MTTRRTLAIQALLVVGLLSAGLHAQNVGIGTSSPHPSARLHISDNARGLLIPNVALTGTNDVTTVSSPATSLLVYNTNTAGTGATAVTPGFYYWDGSQWVRLLGGGEAWLLTGNYSTNPAVNFLGTRDNNSLHIRVNNQQTFQFNTNFSIQRDAGGNARGQDAVDLQRVRSAATQVASGDYSVIGGGVGNTAGGVLATVSGGDRNTASGGLAAVGGGRLNIASSSYATVGGGGGNTAGGWFATVGGGSQNTASGNLATVGGGYQDTASGPYATVGGGSQNTASSQYATVGGGQGNTASRLAATVGGGLQDTASGPYATVGGGWLNRARDTSATVSGGRDNIASVKYATVGGGWGNRASDTAATVSGGAYNTASGYGATVGGGLANTASGAGAATVGGGFLNTASGAGATVCGGWANIASGLYSVVPGGVDNIANADYNLVFGNYVRPSVTEAYRVYFFGDGSCTSALFNCPPGFLVINRLNGDYPIHVGTNGSTTNGGGAYLSGGGTWTNGSSRSFKERFVQYRPAEVLEKILQLPVEGYFYKGTEEYHITPMAEDFYRLFGTGVHEIIETDSTGQLVRRPNPDVDKYLAASDVAGVALLGIQALHEENAQLRQRVADLETENAALRARLERLETLMQRIASTQTNP